MSILYVGIDLAKNVFAVHGVNEAGKAELVRPAVPRDKLNELIANLPPCRPCSWLRPTAPWRPARVGCTGRHRPPHVKGRASSPTNEWIPRVRPSSGAVVSNAT